MIKVRNFEQDDLKKINVQPAQKQEAGYLPYADISEIYTVFEDIQNDIICIIVCTPMTKDRCHIGALVSADSGKYFVALRSLVFKILDVYSMFTRLEATIKADFKQGHRLAKLLGFEYEGTLRKFSNGEDYCMYARVK